MSKLNTRTWILFGITLGIVVIGFIASTRFIKRNRLREHANFFITVTPIMPPATRTPLVRMPPTETPSSITPPFIATLMTQTVTTATPQAQMSSASNDFSTVYASIDDLAEDVELLSKEIEHLQEAQDSSNSREQAIQILVDHIQNLTTLSVSLLVIVPALIERVFTRPKAKIIMATSIAAFVITIIGALASQYSVFVVTTTATHARIANTALFVAWGAFLVGIISIAAFAIINLFSDDSTNEGENAGQIR